MTDIQIIRLRRLDRRDPSLNLINFVQSDGVGDEAGQSSRLDTGKCLSLTPLVPSALSSNTIPRARALHRDAVCLQPHPSACRPQ